MLSKHRPSPVQGKQSVTPVPQQRKLRHGERLWVLFFKSGNDQVGHDRLDLF